MYEKVKTKPFCALICSLHLIHQRGWVLIHCGVVQISLGFCKNVAASGEKKLSQGCSLGRFLNTHARTASETVDSCRTDYFLSHSNFFLYNQKYLIKPKIKSCRKEYPRNSPSRSFMPNSYKDLCRWVALIKGKILLKWMKQLWCVMINLWGWSWFLLYAGRPPVWCGICTVIGSLNSMTKANLSVSFAQNIFEICF